MNLSLLIDRWEKKKEGRSLIEQAVINECISDLKMVITGDLRQPYTLDSIWPMKKYKGWKVREVIEHDPNHVDWCLAQPFLTWFMLDEAAHSYLCQMQGQYHEEPDDSYNDLKNDYPL